MYSFKFDSIVELQDYQKLSRGSYLCIWHADKIPPHIGLSIDGSYYSLKVKGKDAAIPIFEVVKIIKKKNICTVFVEILVKIEKSKIEIIFSEYEYAEEGKSTCLSPIAKIFDVNDHVQMLSDFLNYFKDKQQIGQLFGLNLISDFKGILSYGKEEIEARLKQLSKKSIRNV